MSESKQVVTGVPGSPSDGIPETWIKGGLAYDREVLEHMADIGYLGRSETKDEFGRPLYLVSPEILPSIVHYVRQCERFRLVCLGKLTDE